MKCDHCDQEATVHEVVRKSGKTVERHLCEQCAKKHGIAVQQVPISELIHKYVLSHAGAKACPACGTGYPEFKQHGLLGCAECYAAFESSLGPLLERAHEGGTHHVGKTPRRAPVQEQVRVPETPAPPEGPTESPTESKEPAAPPPRAPAPPRSEASQRAQRLRTLQKQLEDAVKAEQYERAAALRDQIRAMAETGGKGPAAPGAAP